LVSYLPTQWKRSPLAEFGEVASSGHRRWLKLVACVVTSVRGVRRPTTRGIRSCTQSYPTMKTRLCNLRFGGLLSRICTHEIFDAKYTNPAMLWSCVPLFAWKVCMFPWLPRRSTSLRELLPKSRLRLNTQTMFCAKIWLGQGICLIIVCKGSTCYILLTCGTRSRVHS
jgi:hypothetical protein